MLPPFVTLALCLFVAATAPSVLSGSDSPSGPAGGPIAGSDAEPRKPAATTAPDVPLAPIPHSASDPRAAHKFSHRGDLLVPEDNQDLSAFRYDSEVFGWNASYDEVGSVSMQVVRGPQGRHTGEAYMLVYRLGEWLPKHNIICHNITHVDLPDNPVAMEKAEDYLWVIESSYLNMWPHRPIHRRRPGFMDVIPITGFLPEVFKLGPVRSDVAPPPGPDTPALVAQTQRALAQDRAQLEAEDAQAPPLATAAPAPRNDGDRCRPWVGFVLSLHGKRRLQPFVPLDMGARCQVLRRGDAPRIYWGRADVAAAMVHVDFSASAKNEESARFVASAAWRLAKNPRFEVRGAVLSAAEASRVAAASSVATS